MDPQVETVLIIAMGAILVVILIILLNISEKLSSKEDWQKIHLAALKEIKVTNEKLLEEVSYLNDMIEKEHKWNEEKHNAEIWAKQYNTSAHAYSGAEENRPNR